MRVFWSFLLAAQVLFFIYSIPRGLDVTDEAFYQLSTMYLVPLGFPSAFGFFAKGLGFVFGDSVLNLRVLSMILGALSSAALGFSVFHWMKHRFKISHEQKLNLILFFVVVFFMGQELVRPRGLSYNRFNQDFLNLIASGLLLSDSLRQEWWKRWINLGIGVITGLCFLNKFATGTLVFCFLSTLAFLTPEQDFKKRIHSFLEITVSFLVVAIVGTLWIKSIAEIENLSAWLTQFTKLGHSPMDLMANYLNAGNYFWLRILSGSKVLIPILLLSLWLKPSARSNWILGGGLVLGLIYLLNPSMQFRGFFRERNTILTMIEIGFPILLFQAAVRWSLFKKHFKSYDLRLLFALLGFPVFGAFGSNVSLDASMQNHAELWMAFGIVFLSMPGASLGVKVFSRVLPVAVFVMVLGNAVHAFREPYRLQGRLDEFTQSAPKAWGELAGLKFKANQFEFIQKLRDSVRDAGVTSEWRSVQLFDNPGWHLFAGTRPLGLSWLSSAKERRSATCYFLHLDQKVTASKTALYLNLNLEENMDPTVLRCLQSVGIDFEGEFSRKAQFPAPYKGGNLSLWTLN